MSDSVRPHRQQPTRLPHPRDSPGKNIGVGCHFLLQCMKVKSESEVAQSCPTLATPQTAAYQAPPPMGYSRQEYWSGVPLFSPHLQYRRPQFDSWVGKFPEKRDRLPTPVFMAFPGGSDSKESTCNAGDLGLVPGLERSPGEVNGYPL